MKKIYYLSTCTTCKRILKELNTEGFILQDIKHEPITKNQLEEMKELAGSYEALFSRTARQYSALGLKNQALTEEAYASYILETYTFLKRPVVIVEDAIFIGNQKKVQEALKVALNQV